MRVALRLRITGIVQGVGFRPFIYRIAVGNGVSGYVRNLGGSEVEVHVEGPIDGVVGFMRDLALRRPPPAVIYEVEVEEAEVNGLSGFTILRSGRVRKRLSMIPPDIAVCDDCLREVLDPSSRWYMYPFNSCAWCGPRFSMMFGVPYDRENTSMRDFPLCDECLKEYEDPGNYRRFHAQGISCPRCGPKVYLTDSEGRRLDVGDPIAEAARLIDEGFIVGVKGLGGFHIACLATDDDVVLELRRRKRRPQKPFAIMALDLDVASRIVVVDNLVRRLLTSPQRPIILAKRREDAPVSRYVAPGLDTLGVELAYTPLHYLLLRATRDKFLIMTSGNPKGLPMCISEEEALRKLKGVVDYFLMHNRRIVNRVDDSVVRITLGAPVFIRRSRGYAPTWIRLPMTLKRPVIAYGAMLSNTGALGVERYAIPTQYIGDCENVETLNFLESSLGYLLRAYGVDPGEAVIACDLHPVYPTTSLASLRAKSRRVPLIRVQHHHAHVASVMAEHGLHLDEEVVGIAIDGVGYGVDGAIWGGEILLSRYDGFERKGHLEYQPMPGGDLATKYPVRMLVGILSRFLSEEEIKALLERRGLLRGLRRGRVELRALFKALKRGREPVTSSTGRVLDACSALLGVCLERTYEGEPAMKLEAYAKECGLVLNVPLRDEDGRVVIETSKLFEQLVELEGKASPRELAYAFQYSLGLALGRAALRVARRGHRFIAVSGGAAVNEYIMRGIRDAIEGTSLTLIRNRRVPAGDGGVSLGQVAVAGARLLSL